MPNGKHEGKKPKGYISKHRTKNSYKAIAKLAEDAYAKNHPGIREHKLITDAGRGNTK